jgi:hypothetical protein
MTSPQLIAIHSKLPVISYPSTENSHATSKNFSENLTFYKVISKQSCHVHMFTHHAAVLPATIGSTAHHLTSLRQRYSHNDAQ